MPLGLVAQISETAISESLRGSESGARRISIATPFQAAIFYPVLFERRVQCHSFFWRHRVQVDIIDLPSLSRLLSR